MDEAAPNEQAQTDNDFDWQVQIGPEVQGQCSGAVNGTSAAFFVSPAGDPGPTYAQCSVTAGSSWIAIPNNQYFSVSGDNDVQWQLAPPAGMEIKFLIAVGN